MIPVLAPAGPYRAAIAELPLRTRSAERASGAVVVVSGSSGWVDAALDAASDGALALVVADPDFVSAADVRGLADSLGIPIVVERPLLRADVIGDATAGRTATSGPAGPRLMVIDGAAPRARVFEVWRDAVGWVRAFAGADPLFVAGHGAPTLLQTAGGIAAMVSVVAVSRPEASIHAQALGEVLTDVEVEVSRARVATAAAAGRLIAPSRFESSQRLAVRRAVSALDMGERPRDLDELAGDSALVERILRVGEHRRR